MCAAGSQAVARDGEQPASATTLNHAERFALHPTSCHKLIPAAASLAGVQLTMLPASASAYEALAARELLIPGLPLGHKLQLRGSTEPAAAAATGAQRCCSVCPSIAGRHATLSRPHRPAVHVYGAGSAAALQHVLRRRHHATALPTPRAKQWQWRRAQRAAGALAGRRQVLLLLLMPARAVRGDAHQCRALA